ncbi:snRNA-activating protein complex subunit 2 isoform X1 [Pangasianodon hypophthalmus]|uniref:snRNA-activating protein complex subunit 2 isoform X1 n=2 Tax=Pangasianodon hypophthalmus TaxID=310915 RepID=UPI000EFE4F94|nr:snRNA-activating protein complex subunit 2 isoform X1 [Pangasianodon hypophthalmus]
MKPPSRRRITPSRFLELKRTEPISRFRPGCHRLEQRSLLLALKQQNRLNTELDFLALQKKVPKWSLHQIQNMIKFLRRCVVQRVYLQVQKQRREEQNNKIPMELWAEVAQKMAGVHEETISSAFSQMLVIAATEPCSLHHSDPPRTTDSQRTLASGLRTIPLRPMPKSHAGSPPPAIILPGQASKTPQSHGKDAASNPSAQTTTVTSPSAIAEEDHSELQQKTEADKDSAMPSTSTTLKSLLSQPVSKPTPSLSASSAVSTAAPLLTSDIDKQPESGQSEQAWQYRPMGMKSVVDFEKIYQFISNIILKKHTQPLTAMESAVLLDLLMSLPEELPLLDCKELQHHLLQVHTHLNTPTVSHSTDQGPAVANSASTRVTEQQISRADKHAKGPDVSLQTQSVPSTGEESVQKGEVTEQAKATESPLAAGDFAGQSPAMKLSKDKGDWATAGLCPLNPFMVPVALLKRQ